MAPTRECEPTTAAGEQVRAFAPCLLLPRDPPLELDAATGRLLGRALEALRPLEVAGDLLPCVQWFLHALAREEAVLSSQIACTQAALMALLELEASRRRRDDANLEEVFRHVEALGYAWEQLGCEQGLPPSRTGSTMTSPRWWSSRMSPPLCRRATCSC